MTNKMVVQVITSTDEIVKVLKDTRELIKQGALTGFNPKDGDWAEKLFTNQGNLTNMIKTLERE